jgi:hypothetical protein
MDQANPVGPTVQKEFLLLCHRLDLLLGFRFSPAGLVHIAFYMYGDWLTRPPMRSTFQANDYTLTQENAFLTVFSEKFVRLTRGMNPPSSDARFHHHN